MFKATNRMNMDNVMTSLRTAMQAIVNTKRAYMNPHEHFGRF